MRGDRISTTAYDVEMNVGYDCRVLCGSTDSPSKFDESQSSTLHYRITQEYFIHMIIGKFTLKLMPKFRGVISGSADKAAALSEFPDT